MSLGLEVTYVRRRRKRGLRDSGTCFWYIYFRMVNKELMTDAFTTHPYPSVGLGTNGPAPARLTAIDNPDLEATGVYTQLITSTLDDGVESDLTPFRRSSMKVPWSKTTRTQQRRLLCLWTSTVNPYLQPSSITQRHPACGA